MKILLKNITWIFSGIGVAVLTLLYGLSTEKSVIADSAKNVQTIEKINAGGNITIIQSQPSNPNNMADTLTTEKDQLIGALDGEYIKRDNGMMIADAKYDKNEIQRFQYQLITLFDP